jgi:glyoxylase-like metal-dependent hydrolase (beta-lactamase superfamily II)
MHHPYVYHMQPITLVEGVWVFTSALYHTTSTVIRTSDAIIVVDPNWLPGEVRAIRAFVDNISGSQPCCLLFTHADYDHILGLGAFATNRVIASEAFATSNHKDTDVAEVIRSDLEHGFKRDYAIRYPEADFMISEDGQQLKIGDTTITGYLAPGHTAEGLFSVIEPHGVLIAGDYLSDVEFPLVQDLNAYRATLDKVDHILDQHDIRFMIPGHGSVAASAGDIQTRIDQAREYLQDLERTADGIPFPESTYSSRYAAWHELKDWHLENIQRLRGV